MLQTISCNEDAITIKLNHAPKIDSLSASPSIISMNQQTTLKCNTTDEDGDNIEISWTAHEGFFPIGNKGTPVKWQAPAKVGIYDILVIVNDGKLIANSMVDVLVKFGATGGVPCPNLRTITYMGVTYHTVQIADQCWLKEYLNVGTMINSIPSQTDNGIIEKYCYDNDSINCAIYGGLYQWDEAMQYATNEGTQGICPQGWHIPTFLEFETLKTSVNNNGNALKAVGQGTDNGVGTNTSGFSALLAGDRYQPRWFGNLTDLAFIWSSTEYTTGAAYHLFLYKTRSDVYLIENAKSNGYSVRCLRD